MYIDATEIFRKNPDLKKPDLLLLEVGCIAQVSYKTNLFWAKVIKIDSNNNPHIFLDKFFDFNFIKYLTSVL